MRLAQPQLGRVLDRDDALVGADELRQRVQRRRLAGTGPAADEDVAASAHRRPEELQQRRRQRPALDEVGAESPRATEAADRQRRAVDRQRRDHDVHARAVRQAGVDERRRLVDPAAERREHALDHVAQVALALEAHAGRLQAPARARPTRAREPETMISSTAGSSSSGCSGPRPKARIDDPPLELGARAGVEQRRLALDECRDRAPAPVAADRRRCAASRRSRSDAGEPIERIVVHPSRLPHPDRTGSAAVAERARQQPDLAREGLRRREVDRVPQRHPQRRRTRGAARVGGLGRRGARRAPRRPATPDAVAPAPPARHR